MATAEAVRTNVAPELYDFLFNASGGVLSLVQQSDGTPTAAGRLVGSALASSTTTSLQSSIAGNVPSLGVASTFAHPGTRTDELRTWSFRAVTNYTFPGEAFGGWLKGVAIGGAVRRSAAPLLGYAGRLAVVGGSTLAASDVSRPYFGESEALFDAWLGYSRTLGHRIGWRLRLNLRNLGVGNELRPLAFWPDSTVIQWTIKEPQRWTLSSTFTF